MTPAGPDWSKVSCRPAREGYLTRRLAGRPLSPIRREYAVKDENDRSQDDKKATAAGVATGGATAIVTGIATGGGGVGLAAAGTAVGVGAVAAIAAPAVAAFGIGFVGYKAYKAWRRRLDKNKRTG